MEFILPLPQTTLPSPKSVATPSFHSSPATPSLQQNLTNQFNSVAGPITNSLAPALITVADISAMTTDDKKNVGAATSIDVLSDYAVNCYAESTTDQFRQLAMREHA
jgi:hypothetical protein